MTEYKGAGGLALLAVAVLTACSSSGSGAGSTSSPAAPTPSTSAPLSSAAPPATTTTTSAAAPTQNGRANLVLTGSITQTLHDAPATCNYYYPSEKRGVVYEVNNTDYLLQVSDSEGSGTGVVLLNVDGGSSYTGRRDMPGRIVAKLDRTEAILDVTLRVVVGTQTVHVAGTITCSPS